MTEEAYAFLMGSKIPHLGFPSIGTKWSGTVMSYDKKQDRDMQNNPKFYDNGDPMYVVVFTLQTDLRDSEIDNDDGLRNLWARGAMLGAIRSAVREAGYKDELEGGKLSVEYTGNGTPPAKGFNPPKQFYAIYEPPAPDPMEDPF